MTIRHVEELPVDNRRETCGRGKPRAKSQGIKDTKTNSKIKYINICEGITERSFYRKLRKRIACAI